MKSQSNNLSNSQQIIDKLQRNAIYLLDELPKVGNMLGKLNSELSSLPVSIIMQYYCKLHDFYMTTTQYSFEVLANFPTQEISEYRNFIKKYSLLNKTEKAELMQLVDYWNKSKEEPNVEG
jgi:hypothetical protein